MDNVDIARTAGRLYMFYMFSKYYNDISYVTIM
jgi:hypothetical protein